ncbi:conserved protein, unknown function [Hepatocystis sp. ex Piliocolobus tephrosceles]|nr:conserved protein, unknown function [Hepatocystis sp. ex Piliocolobus tephrosceles]
MAKLVNKSNKLDSNNFAVDINGSNDFNKILNEIKSKEQKRGTKIKNKVEKSVRSNQNVSGVIDDSDNFNNTTDNIKLAKLLEKDINKNTKMFNKNMKMLNKNKKKERQILKYKSEQSLVKNDLYDTPIFPRISSLILDHERKYKNSESSHNVNNSGKKAKRYNSYNNQFERHSIYDIYAQSLRKLSIEESSDILKNSDEEKLSFSKSLVKGKKNNNMNSNSSQISNNTFNASSCNFIETCESNISNEKRKMNHKKVKNVINDLNVNSSSVNSSSVNSSSVNSSSVNSSNVNDSNDTLFNSSKSNIVKNKNSKHFYNNNKRNIYNTEEINYNPHINSKKSNSSDSLFENSNITNGYEKCRTNISNKELKIKGGKKKEETKTERKERSEINAFSKRSYSNTYKHQDEGKGTNMDTFNEQCYIHSDNFSDKSVKEEQKNRSNKDETQHSIREDIILKTNIISKNEQEKNVNNENNICNKEGDNESLNNSNFLSTGNLYENEKLQTEKSEDDKKESNNLLLTNTKENRKNMNSNNEDILKKKDSKLRCLNINFFENSFENNKHNLEKKKIDKLKKNTGKEDISNYDKENITTTDSEYNISEKLNIPYEKFKNKNKLFSNLENNKHNKKLLNAINNENVLNIRKFLRFMKEIYIGFIGLQLIYFVTYLLFGSNHIYLIQLISLTCTIFSILDANYHGYLLNGLISLCIAIFLNIAILNNIIGFKSLQTNSVLKIITIINVAFLYLFSVVSFFIAYYIHRLHSLEKNNIKYVINKIESKAGSDITKKNKHIDLQ